MFGFMFGILLASLVPEICALLIRGWSTEKNPYMQTSQTKMLQALSHYEKEDAIIVMQVINGEVSVYDPYRWTPRRAWYRGRAADAQYIVKEALKTGRFKGDIDVLLHVSDMCVRNADEQRFGVLMLCPATGNSFPSHIPFPMWSRVDKPAVTVWDPQPLDDAFKIRKPWHTRKSIALFRGTLKTCDDTNDVRSYATMLSSDNPDLLDAHGINCGDDRGSYLPMEEWENYKYVLHLGQGNVEGDEPRWGDRLKISYLSGAAILQPEQNCNEFFTHHFKPGVDYIPVKHDLSDLLDQIKWARAHDAEVQSMVEHMHTVAMRVLSHDAIVNYTLGVLEQVHGTIGYTVTKLSG